MRYMVFFAVVGVFAPSLAAAEPKRSPSDDKGIQGSWDMISFLEGGIERLTPDKTWQMKFDADSLAMLVDGKETIGCRYKLNSKADPKQIDWITEIDPGKPIVQPGIYKLEGDSLEINVAGADRPRPTTLKSQKGEATTSFVLKRAKKSK